MQRFLQREQDGRYYAGPNQWTENIFRAHAFPNPLSAICCCIEQRLPPMKLVLKFKGKVFDLSIPLGVDQKAGVQVAPGARGTNKG